MCLEMFMEVNPLPHQKISNLQMFQRMNRQSCKMKKQSATNQHHLVRKKIFSAVQNLKAIND